MDADLTSDAVRNRSFGASLRGYDREDVERFREEAALRIDALEAELAEARTRLSQLGIDDVPDLSAELNKVGADISALLDEARRAATDMRERAGSDAAAWRQAANVEASSLIDAAETAARELRSHAWREGTDMLDLAKEEAERLVAAGRQDVLFIRAEAEREVLRMTGEARREAEELMRSARADADQITAAADEEAQLVIAEAQQSVESAVARTHALEQRRSELLQEIEAAHLTLEAMQLGGVEAQRIVRPGQEPPEMDWPGDDDAGAVKIVSAPTAPAEGPVDADELVAEVEQLRSSRAGAVAAAAPDGADFVPAAAEEMPAEPVAVSESHQAGAENIETRSGLDAGDVPESPRSTASDTPTPAAEDEAPEPPPAAAAQPADDAEPAPEPEPEVAEPSALEPPQEAEDTDEPLAGLFAQLRTPDVAADEPATESPRGAEAATAPRVDADAAAVPEPRAPEAVATAVVSVAGEGAFDLRDRLLLPIENTALRAVKRHLVDLQNRVLEELRTATRGWAPDPDEFLHEMSDDIVVMRKAAYVAGVRAAGDMTGRGPLTIEAPPGDPATREFAESLISAVRTSHEHAVREEAGSRELASAISRVFRAWRTDEAERRLRSAAYRSYHQGQLDGFAAAGVAAVTAVTSGRPCAACPAGAEWAPGAALPRGAELPPAHVDCPTILLPAGMAG
ncbi:MAG TPA: DivIVA domain-containing protein [Acidimicrobiia bacterium]|jgi:DivIVA domain-containing protein|nr:DivIVA domain-containing protein [Acidimicrobiia bacterium]